jgi:putative chitinase
VGIRAGVAVPDLARLNGIDDPERVLAGQTLRLPSGASAAALNASAPLPAGARRYVVQAGDTLSDVALRFGTTTDALAHANSLGEPDVIVTGQTLILPPA